MPEVTGATADAPPRRFRPYPKYIDSGVEWLGKIPRHWDIAPVYARYEVALGKMLDAKRVTGESSGRYLRNVDVQWDAVNVDALPEMDFPPADRDRYLLRSGDLLVCEGGEVGRTAIWGDQLDECFYQKAIHRVRPLSDSETPRFFYFLMYAFAKRGAFTAGGNPNTIDHLTAVQLRHYRAPFPATIEQRAIVTFLDRETAKIDALVARKERLIELLQEKRTALITRAVTRGLDPNVPMKDSGVEWLGEIPAHWHLRPLKRVSPDITVGVVVNPSAYIRTEGVPFLYGSNIRDGRIVADDARRMSEEDSKRLSKSCLRAGDLVCVRVGAPGVTAVVPPELAGANCASVLIVRHADSFESQLLCYAMNSRLVRYQVELVQYGAAQEQFNVAHAVDFVVPLAPQAEQRAIATFLDRETTTIDALIAKVREAIDHLRELRAALISAAVTGKIDVRATSAEAMAGQGETR